MKTQKTNERLQDFDSKDTDINLSSTEVREVDTTRAPNNALAASNLTSGEANNTSAANC